MSTSPKTGKAGKQTPVDQNLSPVGKTRGSVNLSGISVVVNNINGQPSVFRALDPTERKLVKVITGKYPKWWDAKNEVFVEGEVTVGAPGREKTANGWREEINKLLG